MHVERPALFFFFFFNDTATTEIYTLSLHDALPICDAVGDAEGAVHVVGHLDGGDGELLVQVLDELVDARSGEDRKSTRLNSSHSQISYAVFCLKKKKQRTRPNANW